MCQVLNVYQHLDRSSRASFSHRILVYLGYSALSGAGGWVKGCEVVRVGLYNQLSVWKKALNVKNVIKF